MAQNVRSYRLAPGQFDDERTRMVRQGTPLYFLMIVVVLAIVFKDYWKSLPESPLRDLIPAIVAAVVTVVLLAYGVAKGIRQAKRKWLSYELAVGQDFLIRKVEGFPDLEITCDEMVRIKELPSGLKVETADKNRFIFVHRALVGYDEVKQSLRGWGQVSPGDPLPWWSQSLVISAVGIGTILLFALFLLARTPWIKIAAGLSLSVLLLFSFIALQRSPHVDKRTERRMLFLILPLVAVIVGTANALREVLR
jgi:SNF family Na+-dependent transporter